ncbi:MAG: hypothetical protein JWN72_956 [Thermoleophilia bacterium]|nr:hypothetical protein [Thermoleophilia bacterium]
MGDETNTDNSSDELLKEEIDITTTEGTDEHRRREQTNGAAARELAEKQVSLRRNGDDATGE